MQSLGPGFCTSLKLPVIRNTQDSLFLRRPSFCSHSLARTSDCLSLRTQNPLAFRGSCLNNRLESGSGVAIVASLSSEGEDAKHGVKKKLAVFVSGGGSNFQSIHEACVAGSVHGEVVALVTNKGGCGGAVYARDNDIPVVLFPRTKEEPNGLFASDLVAALRRYEVDFILLAGYLKLIPVELIQAYPKSILNIHPSLLPAFGGKGYFGMKVHKAVIASGARYSGPTIHFVDEHYDTGRILAQSVVPVLASDTAEELAARVLKEVLDKYCS
ncbi:phosphoribosylglycinamide formyltransferase, chloroplastic isoform X2 [Rhodamnia argentea]|uniref:phosphoribosylglycinamide formyltransferase 1 n=1 Tax=Rhodamnia argentea TaxID=178133 RepID=A0ABM3GTQ7_9MYRT|nr:phosphoribosylglycinamide formyltransferase, chloroplastic isoform X2 [Rhodamnia argentea]